MFLCSIWIASEINADIFICVTVGGITANSRRGSFTFIVWVRLVLYKLIVVPLDYWLKPLTATLIDIYILLVYIIRDCYKENINNTALGHWSDLRWLHLCCKASPLLEEKIKERYRPELTKAINENDIIGMVKLIITCHTSTGKGS